MSTTPNSPYGSSGEPTWHTEPEPPTTPFPAQQATYPPAGGNAYPPTTQGATPWMATGDPSGPRPARRGKGLLWTLIAVLLIGALALGALLMTRLADGGARPVTSSGLPPVAEAPSAPVEQADASAPDWSATAAAVSPSVVSITATRGDSGGEGSGVIIDAQGHVLTNHHVVAPSLGGGRLLVTLADKRVFEAKVVGTDAATDLAVISLQNAPRDLRAITMGDDKDLKVGQPVMAIGNPLGLSGTVTTGIVSALNRPVTTQQEESTSQFGTPGDRVVTNAIQTSAAINPGNSGGALVDASGRLIGINSSIAQMSEQSGNIGIGFAIPVSEARGVAEQIIATGKVAHPYLGVQLTDTVADEGGTKRRAAEIGTVAPGTPAAKANLQPRDAVIAVDGVPVDSALSLTAQVRARSVGAPITLSVLRDGKRQDVQVTLAERK